MPPTEKDKASANNLKTEGNRLFAKGKYAAAAERYTEALTLHRAPALLTNRAFCHKKRQDWAGVEEDSRAALELDHENMKAHYYLGFALRETGQLADAIQHLTKALEQARSSGDSIKDEIWRELADAKYRRWEHESAERTAQRDVLWRRLAGLLAAEHASECTQGGAAPDLRQRQEEELASLDTVFSAAAAQDTAKDSISNAFACRLTLEPFREPVILPSGLSYERSALLQHLKEVGNWDPVTREPCTAAQVHLNLGLRSATQEYLDQNAWAYKDCL